MEAKNAIDTYKTKNAGVKGRKMRISEKFKHVRREKKKLKYKQRKKKQTRNKKKEREKK